MSIEEILPFVAKPSRYCGNEHNVVKKEWDSVSLRFVLAFPDLYEIGMSHHGLQILYHIINAEEDLLAERVYAPDRDFEALLRQRGRLLTSLESDRPLGSFDILGITLPYELCYTNILTILDCAGLPLYSRDRDATHPLVIGGGPCAFHPEPVADFFDAILLGDGEEAVLAMARTVKEMGRSSDRLELLKALARIPGVYVPSFFEPTYDGEGRLSAIRPLFEEFAIVTRAVFADFGKETSSFDPLVPHTRIVHDRLGVELARGCTRGCRFCQAGVIYRPVRERHPDAVFEMARHGIQTSGFDELALLSLSTGDYSCLAPLLVRLMDNFIDQHVSVSMPSMRVGTLTPEIMEQIQRVRKSGFTIAPEAGTDRLRRVINKGITEEDLLDTVKTAFELGWKVIKLYFMYGLPLETDEDLAAIPALVAQALKVSPKGGKTVHVSVGTFVPKPHTPFQWAAQLGIDESFKRIDFLRKNLPRQAKLKWNDPKTSYLEGVFSRGDRRLAAVIEDAWRHGARLDAWSEIFQLQVWREAAARCAIDLDAYLQERSFDEVLPWQHLSAGVDATFLRRELENAEKEVYTPDCRYHGCQKCGLCDFKRVRPIVHLDAVMQEASSKAVHYERAHPGRQKKIFLYRVSYRRLEKARFMGHLELLQVIFRVLKRAELPVLFSQGFNPSPNVSFSPALPVGTESRDEYFIVELDQPLHNLSQWKERLNAEMPEGIQAEEITLCARSQAVRLQTDYQIQVKMPLDAQVVDDFLSTKEYFIDILRKKKPRKIEVRSMVKALALLHDNIVNLTLETEMGTAAVKPMELVAALFGLDHKQQLEARIMKLQNRELL